MTEKEIDEICGTYYCEKSNTEKEFCKGEIFIIFRSDRVANCCLDVWFEISPHCYSSSSITYDEIKNELLPYATKLSPEELMIKDIIE